MKLAPLDWELLDAMADGKRYTQSHFANDLDRFADSDYGYIRQRVRSLHGFGLIQTVGSSQMYEITAYGHAALSLQAEYEDTTPDPITFGQRVRERAATSLEE